MQEHELLRSDRAGSPPPAKRPPPSAVCPPSVCPTPPRRAHPTLMPWILVAWAAASLLAGCSAARLAHPGGEEVVLMQPHWDQVCREDRRPPVLLDLAEVVELSAIEEELESLMPEPAMFAAREGAAADPPHVDLAVNYGTDGRIRTAHLMGYTTDEEVAGEVAAVLREVVRPQGRLLEPVFLRVRVVRGPELQLRVLPALSCLPHVTHEDAEPPRFIGAARVRGGTYTFGMDGERSIAVRLHVAASGRLERIEVVRGNTELLPRLRRAVDSVEFDPALLNGEPVPGVLPLIFEFDSGDEPGG
jgi:hypothetical protein